MTILIIGLLVCFGLPFLFRKLKEKKKRNAELTYERDPKNWQD